MILVKAWRGSVFKTISQAQIIAMRFYNRGKKLGSITITANSKKEFLAKKRKRGENQWMAHY